MEQHREDGGTVYYVKKPDAEVKRTCYCVFPGIDLIYNDIHAEKCLTDLTGNHWNMLEINHCRDAAAIPSGNCLRWSIFSPSFTRFPRRFERGRVKVLELFLFLAGMERADPAGGQKRLFRVSGRIGQKYLQLPDGTYRAADHRIRACGAIRL